MRKASSPSPHPSALRPPLFSSVRSSHPTPRSPPSPARQIRKISPPPLRYLPQGSAMSDSARPSSPGGGPESGGDQSPRSNVREQDRFLPIANISRIMKKALPSNGKIAKDAKETVQECVSEFISFVTSEASDKCQREKRKTINGDDLLWAMATLGFEEYIEPLKLYLQKYREVEGDSKGSVKKDGTGMMQGGGQPGNSMQIPQQGSFAHGMGQMSSQVHYSN